MKLLSKCLLVLGILLIPKTIYSEPSGGVLGGNLVVTYSSSFDSSTSTTGGIIEAIAKSCQYTFSGFNGFGCGIVQLPCETISTTTPIEIGSTTSADQIHGLILRGCGTSTQTNNNNDVLGGTEIRWDGGDSAGSAVLHINSCRGCVFEDFGIQAVNDSGLLPADYGIHVDPRAGATRFVRNTFRNISISDAKLVGYLNDGDGATGTGNQSEDNKHEQVYIDDCPIGIQIANLQTQSNTWDHLFLDDYDAIGVDVVEGFFIASNSQFIDANTADGYAIEAGVNARQVVVTKSHFEDGNSHWFRTVDSAGGSLTTIFDDIELAMVSTGTINIIGVYDKGGQLQLTNIRTLNNGNDITAVVNIDVDTDETLQLTYGPFVNLGGGTTTFTETVDMAQGNIHLTNGMGVTVKTASPYTVSLGNPLASACQILTNDGAAGGVEFDLPAVSAGMCVIATVAEGENLDLDPDDLDTIIRLTNAAGDRLRSNAVGSSVILLGINASEWNPLEAGTWADAN